MKIGYILIIFLCTICLFEPINAQSLDQLNTSNAHNSLLTVYSQGEGPNSGVTDVESGETAHITVQLRTADGSVVPLNDQVITLQLLRLDDDGQWREIYNPSMTVRGVTNYNGKFTYDIFTYQLNPGTYMIKAYYAGNEYDPSVDQGDKLKATSNFNGGLIIHPPEQII